MTCLAYSNHLEKIFAQSQCDFPNLEYLHFVQNFPVSYEYEIFQNGVEYGLIVPFKRCRLD
jgi:hypothetical protein